MAGSRSRSKKKVKPLGPRVLEIKYPRVLRKCHWCGKPSVRTVCERHWTYQKMRQNFIKLGVPDNQASECADFASNESMRLLERRIVTTVTFIHSEEQFYYAFADEGHREIAPARSGPWGKGVAPAGLYYVKRPLVIAASEINKPYTDAEGFAWFARMHPLFMTERKGFGIHPDGNVKGTLGCVGIALDDTKPVYNYLCNCPEPIFILVVA